MSQNHRPKNLLIAGASARAAAGSALRAGFRPAAIDLFGDADLREVADVRVAEDYPGDIVRLADELPPGPWMYTGALENAPEIVEAVSRRRTLWGNGTEVLREVRNPFRVAELLQSAGLPAARCAGVGSAEAGDGTEWLIKPLRSGCGLGIAEYSAGAEGCAGTECYLQERIEGVPISALYLGDGEQSRLIGASRQWIGLPWQPVTPFTFCGAVSPLPVAAEVRACLEEVGRQLTSATGLRGLWGADFVLRDGVPWLVEINPRYTATVELFERAGGVSLLAQHAAVCTGTPVNSLEPVRFDRSVAKLILYAPHALETPDLAEWIDPNGTGWVADLPVTGSKIDPGSPVCTVYAEAATADEIPVRLAQQTGRVWDRLGVAEGAQDAGVQAIAAALTIEFS